MPLFVAATVVRPDGRTTTVPLPVHAPPLWLLLAEELVVAARRAWARFVGRIAHRWTTLAGRMDTS